MNLKPQFLIKSVYYIVPLLPQGKGKKEGARGDGNETFIVIHSSKNFNISNIPLCIKVTKFRVKCKFMLQFFVQQKEVYIYARSK